MCVTLFSLAEEAAPKTIRYKWQNLIETLNKKNYDVRVLILPIAHLRLNPIELCWSQVKQYAKTNNKFTSMHHIKDLSLEKMRLMDDDSFLEKSVQKSMAHAKAYWRMDEELLCQKGEEGQGNDDDNDSGPDEAQ